MTSAKDPEPAQFDPSTVFETLDDRLEERIDHSADLGSCHLWMATGHEVDEIRAEHA